MLDSFIQRKLDKIARSCKYPKPYDIDPQVILSIEGQLKETLAGKHRRHITKADLIKKFDIKIESKGMKRFWSSLAGKGQSFKRGDGWR